jgi:hypothetical protein
MRRPEFQKYGFRDFLRATLLAPLASIPATIVGYSLFFFVDAYINVRFQHGFFNFKDDIVFVLNASFIFILYALQITYLSTAIFGAVGVSIANFIRFRITTTLGIIAGVVCGGTVEYWISSFTIIDMSQGLQIRKFFAPGIFRSQLQVVYSSGWCIQNQSTDHQNLQADRYDFLP